MLRPTDAQQEIRRIIGQLSTNEGLCDSPSKWSFRPLIGCPQLVSRIDVTHPAISQGSATAVDRVLALVRQRHVQNLPVHPPVMTQNVGDGMPWFRHLFTCLALANRPPRPGPTCAPASQSGSNRTYCAPPQVNGHVRPRRALNRPPRAENRQHLRRLPGPTAHRGGDTTALAVPSPSWRSSQRGTAPSLESTLGPPAFGCWRSSASIGTERC
jgi:hypothetical protein